MDNDLTEKKLATLYYNLYKGCLKYQKEKRNSNKEINCYHYYKLFETFSTKYYDINDINDINDLNVNKDIKANKH
jgi:hypothetical protein